MLFRIDIECENEDELETIIADGRWSPIVVNQITSKPVKTVMVNDPDTNNEIEIEIHKMENGAMVGFDGSWLEQFDENPNSPYDDAKVVISD